LSADATKIQPKKLDPEVCAINHTNQRTDNTTNMDTDDEDNEDDDKDENDGWTVEQELSDEDEYPPENFPDCNP